MKFRKALMFDHMVKVICARWGAGAEIGKTHVYVPYVGWEMFPISLQCVTDDFGNLVGGRE